MNVKNCSIDTALMGGVSEIKFWGRKDDVDIVFTNATTLWVTLDYFLHRENFGAMKFCTISRFIPIIVLIIN